MSMTPVGSIAFNMTELKKARVRYSQQDVLITEAVILRDPIVDVEDEYTETARTPEPTASREVRPHGHPPNANHNHNHGHEAAPAPVAKSGGVEEETQTI